MITLTLYLRKDAKEATARRCPMIAGAAAGTAALPPTVPPAGADLPAEFQRPARY